MLASPISRRYLVALTGLICVACLGCSTTADKRASTNNELKQLGQQYMDFFRSKRKTPASEEELKEFVRSTWTDVKKELLKISDPDAMFISPRDKKPFVVRYGHTMPASAAPASGGGDNQVNGEIVAYEAEGSGGYRHVITSLGHLTELKLDELQKLVPDAK